MSQSIRYKDRHLGFVISHGGHLGFLIGTKNKNLADDVEILLLFKFR